MQSSGTRQLSTLTFRYVSNPASEQDRLVNPLGFEVTDYRRDPEAEASPVPQDAHAQEVEAQDSE
ncbi:VirB8/TrbF family protein [Arhodomonas sp. AD133]|uniref:VirB8/TrbF family protein n=1 Tax=Arhodomonas sp. AD133 TaxID=3415009 RepID=UPI003EB7DE36